MKFKEPLKVYTAASNWEAHTIVEMLRFHGLEAFAEEDQSGVSLFAFGTLTQFHQPNVWIEKSTAPKAIELIRAFEEKKRHRANVPEDSSPIDVTCEECGKVTSFPGAMNGTTQECAHCHAYVDVGEFAWPDDGEAEG